MSGLESVKYIQRWISKTHSSSIQREQLEKLRNIIETEHSGQSGATPSSLNLSSSATDLLKERQLKKITHPHGRLRVDKTVDVSICYFVNTGSKVAENFSKHLNERGDVKFKMIPFKENDPVSDPLQLETTIASSYIFVAVLSKEYLKQAPKQYIESCFFPGFSEQPESVRHLFNEKCVTFVEDYDEACFAQVMNRLEEHKRKSANREPSAPKKRAEDIHTRIFLSHKRLTGQGVAGRLYESLKGDYKVFLDSEAEFDIHDLEKIVENTDTFLFILSGGILESEWCIKELRSALKNEKKIVIVREFTYKLPSPLPSHVADLKEVLTKSPTFTWIAEFHNNCVAKLKDTCLGPPDSVIDKLKQYVKRNSLEGEIERGGFAKKTLRIPEWSDTLTSFLHGMSTFFQVQFEGVESLELCNCPLEEENETEALKRLPKLKSLSLLGCGLRDTQFKRITTISPNIKEFHLKDCNHILTRSLLSMFT